MKSFESQQEYAEYLAFRRLQENPTERRELQLAMLVQSLGGKSGTSVEDFLPKCAWKELDAESAFELVRREQLKERAEAKAKQDNGAHQ